MFDDPKQVALATVFQNYARPVEFVQIGAHDGVMWDPVYPFIRAQGWTGLRIEPVQEFFAKLEALHRDDPGIVVVNAAIAECAGKKTLHRLRDVLGAPAWQSGLGTFRRDVIDWHSGAVSDYRARLIEEEVDCLTLAEVLERHHVARVDLFAIDTEGYDYEVVKQIDFDGRRPVAVLYENRHLGSEMPACHRHFRCRDYVTFRFTSEVADDVLAVDRAHWRSIGAPLLGDPRMART